LIRGVDEVGQPHTIRHVEALFNELDLSPQMIAEARKIQPEAAFEVGNVLQLPMADGTFGGALAMYSLINLVRV
jgi:ubiquinone/menaquinone biosynthesis C-methylase UbiE